MLSSTWVVDLAVRQWIGRQVVKKKTWHVHNFFCEASLAGPVGRAAAVHGTHASTVACFFLSVCLSVCYEVFV